MWFGKNELRLYLNRAKNFRLGGAAPAAPFKYAMLVAFCLPGHWPTQSSMDLNIILNHFFILNFVHLYDNRN